MKKIFPPVLVMAVFLSGCVSDYLPPAPPRGDPAALQIAEASASVTRSLTTLEGIRKAQHPQYEKKLPNPHDDNMTQLASVDWTGPIQPLVKRLAIASACRMNVLGTKPAIPVIISIHAQNQSIAQILRNVDYQAGRKAYIKVYPKRRVIALRYARRVAE